MNEISNIGNHPNPERVKATAVEKTTQGQVSTSDNGEVANRQDQAEISELGKILGMAHDLPDVRAEKVAQARIAIEQNETQFIQDRLGVTVDRLIDEVLE